MSTVFPTFRTATACSMALTDQQVNQWLRQNHPEIARELSIEDFHIKSQQDHEVALGSAPAGCEWGCELNDGTHYTQLGIPEKHYLFDLFPGCGRAEICEIVGPYLPKAYHRALCLTFGQGLEVTAAAREMGVCRDTISRHLAKIRRTLVDLIGRARIEFRPDPLDTYTEMIRLMAVSARPPKRASHYRRGCRAYVCDCGRHLDWRRKSHKKDSDYYSCPCGRRYTESERRKLLV